MGIPFISYTCLINGALLLFLLFDFELLFWKKLWSIGSKLSIVTALAFFVVEMLGEQFFSFPDSSSDGD